MSAALFARLHITGRPLPESGIDIGLSCRPYEGPPAAVCTIVTTNCRRSAVVAVYNRTTFELSELAVPPKGLSDVLCRTIPSESSRIQDTADEHAAFAERNERGP